MKSKTKINKQARRKFNPEIVETIFLAKKNKKWIKIANILSRPRRLKISVNLERIEKESKEGDSIVVPGKVLGSGIITKKIRIAALSFSHEAEKRLKNKKCELETLKREIEINPKAEGVKILT